MRKCLEGKGLGVLILDAGIRGSSPLPVDINRERVAEAAGYKRIYLWTCEGLEQAQSIYEQNGFRIAEARKVPQWGDVINEQRFKLILTAS